MTDRARFRYEPYGAPRGPEWMVVHDAEDALQVLILGALFNEHNHTRAIVAAIARYLAHAGLGSAIPDLPGTGESARALADTRWEEWRHSASAAARSLAERNGKPPHIVALRGGALLDDACLGASWWRLAPASGAELLRQMERAHKLGERDRPLPCTATSGNALDLVGYRLDPSLHGPLRQAVPAEPAGPLRVLSFDGPGAAPWRRAEPAADPALSRRLADDIIAWVASCER